MGYGDYYDALAEALAEDATLDRAGWEVGDEVRWADVQEGDRVELFKEHGPVLEANVPSVFCAHRFEDGSERALSRDVLVRVKRPIGPDSSGGAADLGKGGSPASAMP